MLANFIHDDLMHCVMKDHIGYSLVPSPSAKYTSSYIASRIEYGAFAAEASEKDHYGGESSVYGIKFNFYGTIQE